MRPESDAKDRRPRSPARSDPRRNTGAPLPLSGDPLPPLDAPTCFVGMRPPVALSGRHGMASDCDEMSEAAASQIGRPRQGTLGLEAWLLVQKSAPKTSGG